MSDLCNKYLFIRELTRRDVQTIVNNWCSCIIHYPRGVNRLGSFNPTLALRPVLFVPFVFVEAEKSMMHDVGFDARCRGSICRSGRRRWCLTIASSQQTTLPWTTHTNPPTKVTTWKVCVPKQWPPVEYSDTRVILLRLVNSISWNIDLNMHLYH